MKIGDPGFAMQSEKRIIRDGQGKEAMESTLGTKVYELAEELAKYLL